MNCPSAPRQAQAEPAPGQRRIWGGLIVRQECWRLSRWAKLVVTAIVLGGLLFVFREARPFLAVTDRIPSDYLVVEAWCPPYALQQVAGEFFRGHYRHLLVVQGIYDAPILIREGVSSGNYDDSGKAQGNYVVRLLAQDGVPRDRMQLLFNHIERKDRTYHAALTVKQWFAAHGISVPAIDTVTLGPHARRSRLLYAKAFGDEVKVGIIAMDDIQYDAAHWWRTSEGVREVVGEGIAYGYARFLFHPSGPVAAEDISTDSAAP